MARTKECKESAKELSEADVRIDDQAQVLDEQKTKILSLEAALSRSGRMQEELFAREREYGHRIIRLRIEEHAVLTRDRQRLNRLKAVMQAQAERSQQLK